MAPTYEILVAGSSAEWSGGFMGFANLTLVTSAAGTLLFDTGSARSSSRSARRPCPWSTGNGRGAPGAQEHAMKPSARGSQKLLVASVGSQRFDAEWDNPRHRARRIIAEFTGAFGLVFGLSGTAAGLNTFEGATPAEVLRGPRSLGGRGSVAPQRDLRAR
jgi:hypothetical protein